MCDLDDFDDDEVPFIPQDAGSAEELQSVSDMDGDSTFEDLDILSPGSVKRKCLPRMSIPADIAVISDFPSVKEHKAESEFYKPPFYDETWSMGWLSFDELPNGTQHLLKLCGGAKGWDDCPYKIKLHILQMIYDLPKIY